MRPEFTNDGIKIETFDEAFERIANGYREIYGQNINLSQESPDGQRVGIEAKAQLDMQQFCLYMANNLDPDFADIRGLGVISKLIGIFPRPATRSQWDLVVTTDRNIVLSAGYTAEDDLGQRWVTAVNSSLTTGDNVVTFRAEDFGEITGVSGADITQTTRVVGVVSIVAEVDAQTGRDEETVEEFRRRRNRSLENPAYSTVGGLFAKIANLPGVTDLAVYENDQREDDPETGLPANSTWSVVEGGDVASIIEALVKDRTAGSRTVGEIESQFVETLIRPNGTEFNIVHIMRFDRPTYVDVFVRLTVTRKKSNEPEDLELIKQHLANKEFVIGMGFQAGELYSQTYGAGQNYIVTDLEISADGTVYTDGKLSPGLNEKYQIDIGNIDITEVIP